MKITFFSNFLNHHQYPFCVALEQDADIEFYFVATSRIEEERVRLGYQDMNNEEFVIRAYENLQQELRAEKLCIESDVVIIGSAPEKYAKMRLDLNKLLFRYSERIFKRGLIYSFSPRAIRNMWKLHTRYKHKNVYLLCASAFAAADFNRMGAYRNKAYKWGYFPEIKKYSNLQESLTKKKSNTILWVGRFLEWKHPEVVIDLAKRLKADGIEFKIEMIGVGEVENSIVSQIDANNLSECVHLLGAMSPKQVRCKMEESEIFLFTSDFQEGWGAVLNEAMNSLCAVVASHAIGAVPFLIRNGENGLIYKSGDLEGVYYSVKNLLLDSVLRKRIQVSAYLTMITEWNPEVAAERLIRLSKSLLYDEKNEVYQSGPCSTAQRFKNNWFDGKRG